MGQSGSHPDDVDSDTNKSPTPTPGMNVPSSVPRHRGASHAHAPSSPSDHPRGGSAASTYMYRQQGREPIMDFGQSSAQSQSVPSGGPAYLTDRVRSLVTAPEEDKPGVHSEQHPHNTDGAPPPYLQGVPTPFIWRHGGNAVSLAGTFTSWQQMIPMPRESTAPDAPFLLTLELPPGQHQFRYYVDGEWRYDPDSAIATDTKGMMNNVVEVRAPDVGLQTLPVGVTAVERRKPSFSYGSDGTNEEDEFAESDDEYATDSNVQYGYVVPSPEPNRPPPEPPALPPHFSDILLSSTIKQVDPYLLPPPQHVTVNHLYLKDRVRERGSTDVLVLGITQRYKTKFVTTVYYKPK